VHATAHRKPHATRQAPHTPHNPPQHVSLLTNLCLCLKVGLCIAHIHTRRQLHTAHIYMTCHLVVYPFGWLFSPAQRIGRPTLTPDASVDFFARASVCLPVCLCTRFSSSLSLSLSFFPSLSHSSLSLSLSLFLREFLARCSSVDLLACHYASRSPQDASRALRDRPQDWAPQDEPMKSQDEQAINIINCSTHEV
jgi:hypothetical protein